MATRSLETWNETPSLNIFDVDTGGQPEGMARTKVNDSERERMSALSSFYQAGSEWLDLLRDPADRDIAFAVTRTDATTLSINSGTTDVSALFNVGRRIRTLTAGVQTDVLQVVSASYVNPTTTVIISANNGDGAITVGIDACELYAMASLKDQAFRDLPSSGFVIPNGFTDQDVLDAFAALPASGGVILLLAGTYTNSSNWVPPTRTLFWGQGDGTTIINCTDTNTAAHITVSNRVQFQDLQITAPGTGTAAGHVLYSNSTLVNFSMTRCSIFQGYGDHIRFEGASSIHQEIWIDGVTLNPAKGNGIYITDETASNQNINIINTRVTDPGDGAVKTYGIWLAGRGTLSNITLDQFDGGGAQPQTGIYLNERQAADPNADDANFVRVTGILCSGTGAGTVGVEMNGRFCSLTGSAIQLTGGTSVGVRVGGASGSEHATGNRVFANSIEANVGYDELNTIADFNICEGNHFANCTVAVRANASKVMVSANLFENNTRDIEIGISANDTSIIDNTMFDTGGDSIRVLNGSADTSITGNQITGATDDGIHVEVTALNARVHSNHVESSGGVDYVNNAGSEGHFYGNFPSAEDVYVTGASQLFVTAGPLAFISMTAEAFPAGDGGPDSFKIYLIDLSLTIEHVSGTKATAIRIHMGPAGSIADPSIAYLRIDDEELPGHFVTVQTQPDAGDTVTVSVEILVFTSGNQNRVLVGNSGSASGGALRIRRMKDEA